MYGLSNKEKQQAKQSDAMIRVALPQFCLMKEECYATVEPIDKTCIFTL